MLSQDYFRVVYETRHSKAPTSIFTVLGGRSCMQVVRSGSSASPLPPASPDWSPVRPLPRISSEHEFGEHGLAAFFAHPVAQFQHRCTADLLSGATGL